MREDNFIRPNDEVQPQQSKDLQRASNNLPVLEKYFHRSTGLVYLSDIKGSSWLCKYVLFFFPAKGNPTVWWIRATVLSRRLL